MESSQRATSLQECEAMHGVTWQKMAARACVWPHVCVCVWLGGYVLSRNEVMVCLQTHGRTVTHPHAYL